MRGGACEKTTLQFDCSCRIDSCHFSFGFYNMQEREVVSGMSRYISPYTDFGFNRLCGEEANKNRLSVPSPLGNNSTDTKYTLTRRS